MKIWELEKARRRVFFRCPLAKFPYNFLMIGNEAAKSSVTTLFDHISQTGEVSFPFLIIEGNSWLGVMDRLVEQTHVLLGLFQQDLLLLRDLSQEIDKKQHTLKVDVPNSEKNIQSEKYGYVANLGARDISHWLAMAPAGKIKIVLIENIHRMTTSAANALLKSFEEPLPWRLIIGTTDSVHGLLDTIVSRACVISTVAPTLATAGASADVSRAHALVGFAQEAVDELTAQWEDLEVFGQLETEIFNSGAGFRIAQLAKWLTSSWTDNQLLDALIQRADQEKHFSLTQKLFQAKRLIRANINADHVWFSLGMERE